MGDSFTPPTIHSINGTAAIKGGLSNVLKGNEHFTQTWAHSRGMSTPSTHLEFDMSEMGGGGSRCRHPSLQISYLPQFVTRSIDPLASYTLIIPWSKFRIILDKLFLCPSPTIHMPCSKASVGHFSSLLGHRRSHKNCLQKHPLKSGRLVSCY